MKTFALCTAAAVVGLAGGVAPAQNLLNNGGFESPLGFDFSDTSNWNGFFGGPAGTYLEAFNDLGAPARSGSQALQLTINGVLDEMDPNYNGTDLTTGFDAFVGHVQTVMGLSEGTEYEFSLWAMAIGDVTNGVEYRVEWQDAAGVEISRTNVEIQGGLTDSYQQFSFSEVAPTGTARAALVIAAQSFTNDGVVADTTVVIDDASFSVVPAPASAALLGLGGLVAARRRR